MPDETTTQGEDQILVRLDRIARRLTTIEQRLTALERWRMEETVSSLEKTPDD